jgi:hypothetical protein
MSMLKYCWSSKLNFTNHRTSCNGFGGTAAHARACSSSNRTATEPIAPDESSVDDSIRTTFTTVRWTSDTASGRSASISPSSRSAASPSCRP